MVSPKTTYKQLKSLWDSAKTKITGQSSNKHRGTYQYVLSAELHGKATDYRLRLLTNPELMGANLRAVLEKKHKEHGPFARSDFNEFLQSLSTHDFLEALIQTKQPVFLAESQLKNDHSDWNTTERELLSSINTFVPVTIYDNGKWYKQDVTVHSKPMHGYLMLTNGAVLKGRKDEGPTDDFKYLVKLDENGKEVIDKLKFYAFYEARLLPLLLQANATAEKNGTKALVTVPGIGCGEFAGQFSGQLGAQLQEVLKQILQENASRLPHIKAVVFDGFKEGNEENVAIGHMDFIALRSANNQNKSYSQLANPKVYGDKYKKCELYSFVAADPYSYPGCDYIAGARNTDEGAKAAATSLLKEITSFIGVYDKKQKQYMPPNPKNKANPIWQDTIDSNKVTLKINNRIVMHTVNHKKVEVPVQSSSAPTLRMK